MIQRCRQRVIKKTFGESPSAFSDFKLLVEIYKAKLQVNHESKGEIEYIDEIPSRSVSLMQLTKLPNMLNFNQTSRIKSCKPLK